MKWLARCFWLAAWSVWFWLGFGLYRELPREFTQVCKLPLQSGELIVGFLHNQPTIVTRIRGSKEKDPLKVNLWDATTGEKLKSWKGPIGHPFDFSLRHGVVVGHPKVLPENAEEFPADFLQSLDLRTGKWTVLGAMSGGGTFHPREPLVICQTAGILLDTPRAGGFHLFSGAKVFDWNCQPRQGEVRDAVKGCCFSEQGDEVLILRSRLDYTGWPIPNSKPRVLEHELLHCSLKGGEIKAVRFDEPCDYIETPPAGGRILRCMDQEPSNRWDVVDHRSGKVLFTSAQVLGDDPPKHYWISHIKLQLSTDGRFLIHEHDVWEVESGKRIWKSRPSGIILHGNAEPGAFDVSESWIPESLRETGEDPWVSLDRWLDTQAIREFESGRLRYRVWGFHPGLKNLSSDGRLGVLDEGEVLRLPPPPNLRLLALCQAILALPLVILWAILRWRRRRRLRLASAMP